MTKAYSYKRFSTPEQSKGDSLRRQTTLAENYAAKNNLDLDTEFVLDDLGVSAFDGANAVTGQLGAFLREVERGTIKKGSYLLVENLDRLSRAKVSSALKLFLSILESGIHIVTLGDERVFKQETLDVHDLMLTLLNMSRAHDESARKSELKKHSWENKINNASRNPVTRMIPAWLKYDSDGKIVVIEERARVIRMIFNMTLEGRGMHLIIKKLDELNIPPFGTTPSINKQKRCAKKWYLSRINRILTERAVLGEYHPRRSRGGTEVIKDYYPRIISDETFYSVARLRKSRLTYGSTGRKGANVANIFAGLLKCGYSLDNKLYKCAGNNSSMSVVNKGPKSKTRYLQCSRIKEGNLGCEECNRYLRYDQFENLFLEHISNIDYSVIFGTKNHAKARIEEIRSKISTIEGEISHSQDQIKKYLILIESENSPPKSILGKLSELESLESSLSLELESLQSDLIVLQQEFAIRTENESEMKRIFSEALHENGVLSFDQRLRLSNIIRENISSIEVYAAGHKRSQSSREEIYQNLGSEALEYIDAADKQVSHIKSAYFLVRYRSGELRAVIFGSDGVNQIEVVVQAPIKGKGDIYQKIKKL